MTGLSFSVLYNGVIERFRGREAFSDSERSLTYSEIDNISGNIAVFLRDTGIDCGEIVGIYGDRSIEFGWQRCFYQISSNDKSHTNK